MKLSCPAFLAGEAIPPRFAREKGNVSVPLAFAELPPKTQSVAIVMDDPDAPRGTFTHWLLWNVAPHPNTIPENQTPQEARIGRNDFGDTGYGGPRPPSGTHRYFFHAYALDCRLDLQTGASRRELESAMESHVLENATYMGRFSADG